MTLNNYNAVDNILPTTNNEAAMAARMLAAQQNVAAFALLGESSVDDRARTLPPELPGISRGLDGEILPEDHPFRAPQQFASYVPIAVDGPVAAKILEANTCNRDQSSVNIDRLAVCMLNGEWRFNGQSSTIIFSNCEGLDLQHRMEAVVRAHRLADERGLKFRPIVMIPVIGMPKDIFDSFDAGRPRGTKDTLTASSRGNDVELGDVPANEYATALRVMLQYLNLVQDIPPTSQLYLSGLREKVPNHRAVELLKNFPQLTTSMEFCNTLPAFHARGPVVKLHVAGVLHAIISEVQSPTAANTFIRALMTGVNLEEDSPIYRLREQLRNDQSRRIRAEAIDRLAVCVRAWNMVATHKAPPSKARIRGLLKQDNEIVFPAPVAISRRKALVRD